MIITDVRETFDRSGRANLGCLVRDVPTNNEVFWPESDPEETVEEVSSPYIQMEIESRQIGIPDHGVHAFYDEVLHADRFREEQLSSKLRRHKLFQPYEYLDRLSNSKPVWEWIINGGMGDFFFVIGLTTLERQEGQCQDVREEETWYLNGLERVIAIQYQLWTFDSLCYRKFGDEYLQLKSSRQEDHTAEEI